MYEKFIPTWELANVKIEAMKKQDLVNVSGFTFDNNAPQ